MAAVLESDGASRADGASMDADRRKRIAHEYLVHIGEAKDWIEACIDEELPAVVDMEASMRNAVVLAKLAKFFEPKAVKKIYDEKQEQPLNLRHSDNFNTFRVAALKAGLPVLYFFELTDLYDSKNMPKVIYMLHALSHFLAKKGIAPRMNNLMGQLFFTDEELEQASKNLGNIAMPAFGDLGASMDRELGLPVTENEQIRREVREKQVVYEQRMMALLEWTQKATAEQAQPVSTTLTQAGLAQARGAFDEFVGGDMATHAAEKASLLAMFSEINNNLKSHDMGEYEVDAKFSPAAIGREWAALDGAVAARRAALDQNARRHAHEKGANDFADWCGEVTTRHAERDFVGRPSRELEAHIAALEAHESGAKAARREQLDGALLPTIAALKAEISFSPAAGRDEEDLQALWAALQAGDEARAAELARQLGFARRREDYEGKAGALAEGMRAQQAAYNARDFPDSLDTVRALIDKLASEREGVIAGHRAAIEAIRPAVESLAADAEYVAPIGKAIADLEELLGQVSRSMEDRERALLEKKRLLDDAARAKHFRDHEGEISQLQANLRGFLGRREHQERLKLLREREEMWEKLQAIAKGNAVRRAMRERKAHYNASEDRVRLVQAAVRGKAARDAYAALTGLDNPPVDTVQRFLYLLDESDHDFDEELELERLKQLVVLNIRENGSREVELNALDIKIALLIRNRSSLEEIVETTKKFLKQQRKGAEGAEGAQLSLKLLDKDSRARLESYQHLFYLLQTEPQYLAKLLVSLKANESQLKDIETSVMTLYGFAQNAREEYLLLKLFRHALQEEMVTVSEEEDILRGNPVFIKLVVHYTHSARERQFLRELLQPLIKEVIERDDLDLDVDPLSIYRWMIREEESRTGEKSSRPYDVSRTQALDVEEVFTVFEKRVKDLRAMTDKFLTAIIASLPKMPYGLRSIAKQMYESLTERFPGEAAADKIIKIVGHLIYYRYMNPAIVAPEGFDVIETVISSMQRKNLGEISRMLVQVSVNKQFDSDSFYLVSLNGFLADATARLFKYFRDVASVPSPEDHFQIDKYDDMLKISKPLVYLSQEEIFRVHHSLDAFKDEVAPAASDHLRVILGELGAVPPLPETKTRGQEISLTLSNRFPELGSEEARRLKTTFVTTKKYCVAILRVVKGKSLLEILESPVTAEHQKLYETQLAREDELRERRQAKTTTAGAGASTSAAAAAPLRKSESAHEPLHVSLAELKKRALANMAELEKGKLVSREDKYQSMLTDIAKDIRNKNRRRIQRRAELAKVRQTLGHLDEKSKYLEQQKQSYQDYVNSCIAAMSDKSKKGKKKAVLPFTKQYFHMQKMKREGKVFKLGSYSYTAERLFQKGVLVELEGISESQRNKVSLTISSDEVGMFQIEGKFLGLSVDQAVDLRLDDLLQKQFDHIQIMNLGIAKVNVNLLIFLINKKFFQQ